MNNDFYPLAFDAFKANIRGLSSFCRLTMLELLSYCDYTTGVISIDALDELARKDFQVAPAPGRKKEDIDGDTIRNAFRSIKKARPEQFIFSRINQRITIEMPFMRELYERFCGKSQEVAAVDEREAAMPTTLFSIDESACFATSLSGEDAGDVAAASSRSIRDINNKINKLKLTNQTDGVVENFSTTKQPIQPNFYPDAETIIQALSMGLKKVVDTQEIAAFIRHNQERNTQWENFNPVYLQWLERGAEYKQRQLATKQSRSNYVSHGIKAKQQDLMELARAQNRDAMSPSGQSYAYTIDIACDNQQTHELALDGADEYIWETIPDEEWNPRQRRMA